MNAKNEVTTWNEFKKIYFTPEENAELELKVALINEIVQARQELGISQRKLEELSGVKQPVIARMENNISNSQIDTILKVLYALGKTLKVVSINDVINNEPTELASKENDAVLIPAIHGQSSHSFIEEALEEKLYEVA